MARKLRPYSVDLLREDGSLRFSTCPVFAEDRPSAVRKAQERAATLGVPAGDLQEAFVFLGLTTNGTYFPLRGHA